MATDGSRDDAFTELDLASIQIEIVDAMAGIIADRIRLPERVVRGFIWKCMRDWQQEHGKRLVEISEVPAPTRFENFRKVADCFRRHVLQVLPDSRHPDLDLALEVCADEYRRKYEDRG